MKKLLVMLILLSSTLVSAETLTQKKLSPEMKVKIEALTEYLKKDPDLMREFGIGELEYYKCEKDTKIEYKTYSNHWKIIYPGYDPDCSRITSKEYQNRLAQ